MHFVCLTLEQKRDRRYAALYAVHRLLFLLAAKKTPGYARGKIIASSEE
jgi:hypothetical protein